MGGVTIPHDKGLLGHSDADVLTHAIMDAMLSAVALRDIGYHFPDNDPAYKGANSMKLLDKVVDLIKEQGYLVESLSASITAGRTTPSAKIVEPIFFIIDALFSFLTPL